MWSTHRNFLRGCLLPRKGAPFWGALICLMTLILSEILLSFGFLALGPKSLLLVDDTDYAMDFRHNIAAHHRSSNKEERVFLVGGSSLRESIVSVNELMKNRTRGSSKVIRLGITGLSLLESLSVVEQLPNSSSTLVLGINFGRFDDSINSHLRKLSLDRVGLRSTEQVRFLSRRGSTWRPPLRIEYFFPHLNRYFRKHGWNFLRGVVPMSAVPSHSSLLKKDRLILEQKWEKKRPGLERRFESNLQLNLDVLRNIFLLSNKKGFQFILLDLPVSPLAKKVFRKVISSYRDSVEQWARKSGASYLNFVWNLPLKEGDFYDGTHLLSSGQRIFQSALAKHLDKGDPQIGLPAMGRWSSLKNKGALS